MFLEFALEHTWLIPLLPALAFPIIGLVTRQWRILSAGIALTAIFASFLLAAGTALAVVCFNITVENPFTQHFEWVTIGSMHLQLGTLIDPLTAMMLVVVTLVSLLVEIYSSAYMADDPGYGRFFAYISLFAASMLGLVIAVNFIQMYIFWELVGLCSYLLIGFYYYKISAREAAKKAFITTRVGDFGLLLGILLLQCTFGTLDFLELRTLVPAYILSAGTGFMTLIGLLLFVGPIGKSGQFPLHVWLPDAMEGPTPVSALIHAATMVVAGVYLVARAYFIFSALPVVMNVIAWLGGFTAIFAASIALTQRPIKRILAYSTISQLGYMMLALGVGSLSASLFHLMTHAFFKAMLFLGAGAVMHAMHEEADIFKMGGLARKMPVTCAAMTIGVLAISGLPPFAGFFSKDEIIAAAASVSMPLCLLAMVTAFMTAFYMARLLFVVFFAKPAQHNDAHEVSWLMQLPLLVLAVLSTVSGMWGHFAGFGEWVRYGAAQPEEINWLIAGTSTVMTLVAFVAAWGIYVMKLVPLYTIREKLGPVYALSYHKYFVDEFYTLLIRFFVDGLAKVSFWIDQYLINGFVDTLCHFVGVFCSRFLTKPQDGVVQRYVAVFFGGVIILLIYSLFFAEKIMMLLYQGGAF